jgi:hypothetical protein
MEYGYPDKEDIVWMMKFEVVLITILVIYYIFFN